MKRRTMLSILCFFSAALVVTVSFQVAEEKFANANTMALVPEVSAESIPVYVFNGAYLTYTLNDYYNRKASFTISEVNLTAQTFKVTWTYIGDWSSNVKGSSKVFSFTELSPFPTAQSPFPFSAVSPSDLEVLNRGEIPTDLPAVTLVSPNLSVFARGGAYFDVVEIKNAENDTILIDRHSGVAVIEDLGAVGNNWGMGQGELNLVYTNIPMTPTDRGFLSPTPSPTALSFFTQTAFLAALGIAVAAVAAIALGLYLRSRKRTEPPTMGT